MCQTPPKNLPEAFPDYPEIANKPIREEEEADEANEISSLEIGEKDGTEIMKGTGAMVIGATFNEEMKASTRAKKHREIEVLNQRMVLEVSKSIEVAYEITPLLDLYGIKLEIHADINPDVDKGLSAGALSEAVGYIMGMGYDFKIKPDAWAASKAADKLC